MSPPLRRASLLILTLGIIVPSASANLPGGESRTAVAHVGRISCPHPIYYLSVHPPCVGPIQVAYAFGGQDPSGPTSLMRARFRPVVIVRLEHNNSGQLVSEVKRSSVTWHSVPSVIIVGVYIVHNPCCRGSRRHIFDRVSTGPHSGSADMPFVTPRTPTAQGDTTQLLLEGRRVGHSTRANLKPSGG